MAVNDQKVASIDVTFDQAQFAGDGVVIKKGKKVFHRAYFDENVDIVEGNLDGVL